MDRLTGEARDRVRALSLGFVAALTLMGVAVGLYAVLVGFDEVSSVRSEVVAVSEDERELTVQIVHNSCQELIGVGVEERADVVVLTAQVVERVRLQAPMCTPDTVVSRATVVLDEPLSGRDIEDGAD